MARQNYVIVKQRNVFPTSKNIGGNAVTNRVKMLIKQFLIPSLTDTLR